MSSDTHDTYTGPIEWHLCIAAETDNTIADYVTFEATAEEAPDVARGHVNDLLRTSQIDATGDANGTIVTRRQIGGQWQDVPVGDYRLHTYRVDGQISDVLSSIRDAVEAAGESAH